MRGFVVEKLGLRGERGACVCLRMICSQTAATFVCDRSVAYPVITSDGIAAARRFS
jgi:hypothetical protein